MQKLKLLATTFGLLIFGLSMAQDGENGDQKGHENTNKFRQMYQEFATPNLFRTGSGAPGSAYYQQQADYKMDITLNDDTKEISGEQTITYTNNAPESLDYLWLQLDQNIRTKDSKALIKDGEAMPPAEQTASFVKKHYEPAFDGGFNITQVKDGNGKNLPYTINQTMMRVEMDQPLKSGEQFVLNIKWWYKINNHLDDGARSGYEEFPDGNRNYVIAQFYPRMAAYTDVEGWLTHQFWGDGKLAPALTNLEVRMTVHTDHTMEATGTIQTAEEVLTDKMIKTYETSTSPSTRPVFIVTEVQAMLTEKGDSTDKS